MKRSEINQILHEADAFIREKGFHLPPFAYWKPEDWAEKQDAAREIIERRLGWDITDFGQGDFEKIGLFLFTIRNGSPKNLQDCQGQVYAEKILIAGVGQKTPLHFHWSKTEDIINRGGGKLAIQVYNATRQGELAETPVKVMMDGLQRSVSAGEILLLSPGESITLPPYLYHAFWGVDEKVLVGEVSAVNDDDNDNRFYDPIGRFPSIEEDEPPLYLLVKDYALFVTPEEN